MHLGDPNHIFYSETTPLKPLQLQPFRDPSEYL